MQHDVRGLDVAVDDDAAAAGVMQEGERGGDRLEDVPHEGLGDGVGGWPGGAAAVQTGKGVEVAAVACGHDGGEGVFVVPGVRGVEAVEDV